MMKKRTASIKVLLCMAFALCSFIGLHVSGPYVARATTVSAESTQEKLGASAETEQGLGGIPYADAYDEASTGIRGGERETATDGDVPLIVSDDIHADGGMPSIVSSPRSLLTALSSGTHVYSNPNATPLSSSSWSQIGPSVTQWLGQVPYTNGDSPSGWDCSGYVWWCLHNYYGFGQAGRSTYDLEGVAGGQAGADGRGYTDDPDGWTQHVAYAGYCSFSDGEPFDMAYFSSADILPGDIILFYSTSNQQIGTSVHTGIAGGSWSGDFTLYHALTPETGTYASAFTTYWWDNIYGGDKRCWSFVVLRGCQQGGTLTLNKTSALPDWTENRAEYSLEGALYGVYSDAACTTLIAQLTTGESGSATSARLASGTYYVKEISASPGYALDTRTHMVDIAGNTALDVTENPLNGPAIVIEIEGEAEAYSTPVTGFLVEPTITVTRDGNLVDPSTYTVAYGNNLVQGTATVTATGPTIGTVSKDFELTAAAPVSGVTDGATYTVNNAAAPVLALDAANTETGLPVTGSNVSLWAYNGGENQKWIASFDPATATYTLANAAACTLVLDAEGSTPVSGANVTAYTDGDRPNQRWVVQLKDTGTYAIYSYASTMTMAAPDDTAATSSTLTLDATRGDTSTDPVVAGANVTVWNSNGGANQRWTLNRLDVPAEIAIEGEAGTYSTPVTGFLVEPTITVTRDGNLVDPATYTVTYGNNLVQGTATVTATGVTIGTMSKDFELTAAIPTPGIKTDGIYTIYNAASPTLVLDASGPVPVSGATVSVYTYLGQSNQRWAMDFDTSRGTYTLHNQASPALSLDASGATPVAGASVTAYTTNNADNQRWVVQLKDTGTYALYTYTSTKLQTEPDDTNPSTTLILEGTETVPVAGAIAEIWSSNGGANQRWTFSRADTPTPLTGTIAVTGGTTLGSTLTATLTDFPADASAAYQWSRADTTDGTYTAITDATDVAYATTTDDFGAYLKCSVTDANGFYAGSLISTAQGPIGKGNWDGLRADIEGSALVGATLTVSLSNVPSTGVTSCSYTWQRADTATGTYSDIVGATDCSYIPSADDHALFIRCMVTMENSLYELAPTSTEGVQVAAYIEVTVPLTASLSVTGDGTLCGASDYELTNQSLIPVRVSSLSSATCTPFSLVDSSHFAHSSESNVYALSLTPTGGTLLDLAYFTAGAAPTPGQWDLGERGTVGSALSLAVTGKAKNLTQELASTDSMHDLVRVSYLFDARQ